MKENVMYSYAQTLGAKPTFQDEPWKTYCEKLLVSSKRPSSTELKQMPDGPEFESKFGHGKAWAQLPHNMSALFHHGTSRRNSNVFHMGNILIVDIDQTDTSFEQMHAKLKEMNVCFALHTTTSHSTNSPSYRIHFPIDEPIEIEEYPLVWGNLNDLSGGNFDPKTHDLARCMYLPRKWDGKKCQIKVETEKEFLALSKLLHMVPREPTCSLMKKQKKHLTAVRKELSNVEKGFGPAHSSVHLKTLVDDHARSAYAMHKGGRLYTFMRRVAANAHYHGICIKPQELADLALQEDAANHISKNREGILKEAQNAIGASLFSIADKQRAANENTAPLVTPRPSNLVVEYIDAQCGQGKSWSMLEHITKQRRLWIYACDKILTLNERASDLVELNNGTANPSALEFTKIYKGKVEKGRNGEALEVEYSDSVLTEIHRAKADLTKRIDNGDIDAGVLFITHRALVMMDWTGFERFSLVVDEIPEAVCDFTRSLHNISAIQLAKYMQIIGDDGGCYEMGATELGRERAATVSFDEFEEIFSGLVTMANDAASTLWVEKGEWDGALANRSSRKKSLGFFSLFRASCVQNFVQVYVLGDELLQSRLYKAWSKIDDVKFKEAEFWHGGRQRRYALKDRVTVHYFCDDNASFGRIAKSDDPLAKISIFLADNVDEQILYSVNERNLTRTTRLEAAGAKWISPKAHGRNDLQDFSTLVWLACMKTSGQARKLYEDYIGMTAKELDREKDFNACYQFIMRGVLRKFDSGEHCDVYVFSKEQAEYLRGRLGGCPVKKIQGLVANSNKKCGRPSKAKVPKPKKPAMTPAERQRRCREKKNLARLAANSNLTPSPTNKDEMFQKR